MSVIKWRQELTGNRTETFNIVRKYKHNNSADVSLSVIRAGVSQSKEELGGDGQIKHLWIVH